MNNVQKAIDTMKNFGKFPVDAYWCVLALEVVEAAKAVVDECCYIEGGVELSMDKMDRLEQALEDLAAYVNGEGVTMFDVLDSLVVGEIFKDSKGNEWIRLKSVCFRPEGEYILACVATTEIPAPVCVVLKPKEGK